MKFFKSAIALSFVIALIFSCKKDESKDSPIPQGNTAEITLSGQVVSESGQALKGVAISIGSINSTTDENGVFLMQKIRVHEGRVFISASKSGYFNSGRNVLVVNSETLPVVIMMMPKKISGALSASAGGTVATPEGLEVSLPANAIKGGYTGQVNIATHVFDPTSDQFILEIPGSLDAIDANGVEVGLRSYAMAIIELSDDQGQKLELAEGKKASLIFPIAQSDLATAPTLMPLWYFDEVEGVWKEEGQATRNGNVYEGEVSHFTPWNCDLSRFRIVVTQKIRCDSIPVKDAVLKMIDKSDNSVIGLTYTNSGGIYNTLLPENANIDVMLVYNYGQSYCETKIGSITTGTQSAVKVDMVACPKSMTIKGSVVGCNNEPITNGYVYGSIGSFNTLGSILDASGKFSLSTYYCPGASDLKLTAWDISTLSKNSSTQLPLSSGIVNLTSPITICGTQVSINNTAYFAGADENFYALNRTTGAVIWSVNPGNGIYSGASAFENGIFYVINANYELCAINASDGSILWKKGILAYSVAPLAKDGVVYVGSKNGKIYALNASSGSEIWSYDTDGNSGNSTLQVSSPTIYNGVLYIGTSTTKVIGLDVSNGSLVWSFNIDKDAVYTNPAINGGKLFVTSSGSNGILYAINLQDSSEVWRVTSTKYLADPVTDASRVYVHVDDALYAYNLTDGTLAWSYPIGTTPVGTQINTVPFVENGKIYVGGRDGKMKCLSAATGSLIWDYAVTSGSVVYSSPTIADDIIYFTGNHIDNNNYALNATSGNQLWTFPIQGGGNYKGSMVVIDQNGNPHFSGLSGAMQ